MAAAHGARAAVVPLLAQVAVPWPRLARLRGPGRSGDAQLLARHVLPDWPRDAGKVELGQRGRAVDVHGRDLDEVRANVGPLRGGHHEDRAGAGQDHRGQGRGDELYRTGRRYRRVDDKGDCTRKPSVRQRKATLVARPYHPELAAAYASLMDPASARAGLKGGM